MNDIYHPKDGCELKSVVLGRETSKKKKEIKMETPKCNQCNSSANMINHDGEWVCHSTHRVIDDIPTPETNACYVRAGMRLDNQVDELDATCRKLERELFELKSKYKDHHTEAERLTGVENALIGLLVAQDIFGDGASLMHPRLTMALTAARKSLK